jgi:hypothetical protein
MTNGTGLSQAKAALELANIWEVKNSIVGFCFDTTASNTGVRAGSATIIKKELNRRLLWLSCRHHMYELHIKHAFSKLFGERTGPDDLLFKWFQSTWPDINLETNNLSKPITVAFQLIFK